VKVAAAAWPAVQASGDGRRKALVTLRKAVDSEYNDTVLAVLSFQTEALWIVLIKLGSVGAGFIERLLS